MSAFTELVDSDLDIFLNGDEFADDHEIDGKTVRAVLENEQVEEKEAANALSRSIITLFAKTADLPARKMQGETLYLDNVGYTVETWLEEMGMTRVMLSLPESW